MRLRHGSRRDVSSSDVGVWTPGPEETADRLVGSWRVLQLRRGHRFSTDDLVTAYRGSEARPHARRLLDLGCGIGSVGLSALHRVSEARARAGLDAPSLVGVEVQEISAELARRSVVANGLAERVRIVHGDLRAPDVLEPHERFDLVTGSPPYIPLGAGAISPHPQRAGARIELRGSVYDYCAAARRFLAEGGRFCFVMAAADPRTEDAPRAHGLTIVERWDYVFRAGAEPLIATLVCAREEDEPDPVRQTGRLVVRGPDGAWTDEYLAFRGEMGPG